MAFPLNSAGTATVISALPFTTADTFGGTPFGETWWTYTAAATDVLLGVQLATDGGAGDTPTVEPFVTLALTPAVPAFVNTTIPIQVPVTGGVAYYFKLTGESGTATLTFTIHPAPTEPLATGMIVVPDPSHAATFPPTVLAFGADAVVAVLSLPGGDQVDCLPNGIACLAEIPSGASATVTQIRLFQTLTVAPYVQTLVTVPNPLSPALVFVKQDHAAAFYLAKSVFGGAPLTVVQLLTDGTTPQTWTLPGSTLAAFAVSVGGTTAYTSDFSTDTPIGAYDLLTSTALPSFAAGVTGYKVNSLTVLADDSVVATYLKTADQTIRILRYAADGSLLATFDAPGTQQWVGNVACGADDPVSVVVRTENAALTTSTFWHLLAADLSVLDSFTVDNFDDGEGRNTTAQFFGPSEASSFFVWNPPPPTPAYTLDERHIRRLRRAPHVNHEHQRVFFRSFELDLERGQGLATGQGEDPLITLRLSRDGGQTWGEPIPMHAGRLGAYTQRVIARRLGHGRDVVFEVTVSDPVAWSLVGAWLNLEPGTS